ncbi:MAG: Trypsin-like serine protease [Rhodospirillales bacterium]|nr:Trypsin-like serine protease [Rhodospirillales bacterium]
MVGFKKLAKRHLLGGRAQGKLATLVLGLLTANFTASGAPSEAPGASPGERSAIRAYCSGERTALAQNMCISNQLVLVRRLGRKPDLSAASQQQRAAIRDACSGKRVPGERFACERKELTATGLTVGNEPGGGSLQMDMAATAGGPQEKPVGLPFFSLQKWRQERPAMPVARGNEVMSSAALFEKVGPSVYVVLASEHAIELAARTEHSQGSGVAITDKILLTNCHVVAGRPQISVSQDGKTSRADLIYADPGGDRCFLSVDTMTLHPIQGVRRTDDIRIGETVYSVGTPAGLERSFGQGLVSGLRQWEGVRIVQNSAPTWHGSSGGGLFDARGNLVGITTAIDTIAANINFSIAAEEFWP